MARGSPAYQSIFSILRPAVGPSSSHTLGPLLCARDFRARIERALRRGAAASLRVELYGSLAATGKGHRTDLALIAGLSGERPEEDGSALAPESVARVQAAGGIAVKGTLVRFDPARDIRWIRKLPAWSAHPNTMRFVLTAGRAKHAAAYVSLGAGLFTPLGRKPAAPRPAQPIPYPYRTMHDLLAISEATGYPISLLVLADETAFAGQNASTVLERLDHLWRLMKATIERGLAAEGELPGGLGVMRRAKQIWEESRRRVSHPEAILAPALKADAYAFAVAEENAAGGAIVTAPTAGSAGVIPAVLKVWQEDLALPDRTVARGLLTAGAVGIVIKNLASLSGAEVGCQGEVGSAAAMAAAAAAELAGAIPAQVEAAAEVAIEHHLGMTCDPVAGLVQIPCIERNAMGAVKALNAAAVSLAGTGRHLISFDAAVRAMWRTGQDLRTAYRETARGGLAVEGV
ncbi:MAG TPA: L-serine ammonia-lyase [Planctomycetes bacterium]|nr:L-serine ammonia-lyase [Planctomycetota bacterium]